MAARPGLAARAAIGGVRFYQRRLSWATRGWCRFEPSCSQYAIEAIERCEQADTVVLVSGDGDFVPLVKHLKRAGKRVEVAAFGDGLSVDLATTADAVTRLGTETLE